MDSKKMDHCTIKVSGDPEGYTPIRTAFVFWCKDTISLNPASAFTRVHLKREPEIVWETALKLYSIPSEFYETGCASFHLRFLN
jgi:hypothetical protein